MEEGVYIRYCLDGSLFDLQHLNTKTKCLHQLIQEALVADDCVLLAHKDIDLQMMLNKFSQVSKAFGLTISLSIIISNDGSLDKEITSSISKAS